MAVLSNKGKRIDELVSLNSNQISNVDLLVIQDVQPTSTTKNVSFQSLKDKISTDIQSSQLTLFPSSGNNLISASKIHVTNRGTFHDLRVLNSINLPDTTSFNNTITNFNNVNITGSATIYNVTVTNRLTAANITGSLKGTGSVSRRSISASHALISNTTLFCETTAINADTSSFLVYSGTPNGTASFSIKTLTSSFSFTAISSSYADFALNADSATTANNAITSDNANNAYTASYILFDGAILQGSFNGTSSFATNAKSASFATNAKTASYYDKVPVFGRFSADLTGLTLSSSTFTTSPVTITMPSGYTKWEEFSLECITNLTNNAGGTISAELQYGDGTSLPISSTQGTGNSTQVFNLANSDDNTAGVWKHEGIVTSTFNTGATLSFKSTFTILTVGVRSVYLLLKAYAKK